MNKLKEKKGLTLIEMLSALAILVFLVVGMDTAMSSSARIYEDSIFESNCSTLSGIINTAVKDFLLTNHTEGKIYTVENVDFSPCAKEGKSMAVGSYFVEQKTSQPIPADVNRVFLIQNFPFVNLIDDKEDTDSALVYLTLSDGGDTEAKTIIIRNLSELKDGNTLFPRQLVNHGAYPDLSVSEFTCSFVEDGGYYDISYTIESLSSSEKSNSYHLIVRPLNT